MKSFDYKKEFRELYQRSTKPTALMVPQMKFLTVEGEGDPNTEYKAAIEIVYGLSYMIKMWKLEAPKPKGFFDYVVPPLEGLWYGEGITGDGLRVTEKNKFQWFCMLRQPEFVTEEILEEAKAALCRKKPKLHVQKASLKTWTEGLCVQMMHSGPYDRENLTIAQMRAFCKANGYEEDLSEERLHHEIYLSDPRKCAMDKMRTVIRHPIREID